MTLWLCAVFSLQTEGGSLFQGDCQKFVLAKLIFGIGQPVLNDNGKTVSFGAQNADTGEIALRVLATSDLHANLMAWDYHANRVCEERGITRVAALIRRARAEQPQSLLFDNGDFLHGTVLGDFIAETTPVIRSGRPLHTHPVIAAMNALGYDAAALGNHEFGHGLGFLRRSLAATRFPIVCSNLYFKPSRGAPIAQPFVILERELRDRHGVVHPVKIGVMGFIPPQTAIWEKRYLKSRASVDDIVNSAKMLVPILRAAGADLIIALSHSGIGSPHVGASSENASSALAAIAGVDVIIAGHTHLTFPTADQPNLSGKPAVMPGFFGSHLGVIDLRLRRQGGKWQVAGFQAENRAISRRDPATGQVKAIVADDPAILALAKPAHDGLLARAEEEVGFSKVPLHSYFSLLAPTPALDLVATAQADYLKVILKDSAYASLPMLSAVAPFKAGGRGGPENYTDVPAGPLRLRHANDLYMHPNSLSALRVSGQDIADWLERSVSIYHQVEPGAQDVALLDESFASFNFDVIHGLSYGIDLSQPARFNCFGEVIAAGARRIRYLHHLGQPVRPDQMFVLATNSYRAAGGAGFSGTGTAQVIYEGRESNREVLLRYLRQGGLAPQGGPEQGFSFLPMVATTAVIDLGPRAIDHLAEVSQLRLQDLGLQASGFRRFRLHL